MMTRQPIDRLDVRPGVIIQAIRNHDGPCWMIDTFTASLGQVVLISETDGRRRKLTLSEITTKYYETTGDRLERAKAVFAKIKSGGSREDGLRSSRRVHKAYRRVV